MLKKLGHASLDALIDAIVPPKIRRRRRAAASAVPDALPKPKRLPHPRDRRHKNQVFRSFIGQGYYDTHTPAVILRNVLENPAWYTAYTPYQAEISQGRLEALINFQTMVADLTGMDIANASMLDEATAAAEAMTLLPARRQDRSRTRFFVADDVLPQTHRGGPHARRAARHRGRRRRGREMPRADDAFARAAAVPGRARRRARLLATVASAVHASGGLVVVAADLLALTLLKPPGEWAPTSSSARASASACRWASADRTPGSSRPAMRTSAACRAASSA